MRPLTRFAKPMTGEGHVEGVLPRERPAGVDEAVGRLLEHQSGQQVTLLWRHLDEHHRRFAELFALLQHLRAQKGQPNREIVDLRTGEDR